MSAATARVIERESVSDKQAPEAELLTEQRFRKLLGEDAWHRLPAAVQRRFAHAVRPGEAILYRGRVAETTLSPLGRLLSVVAQMIGSPLPETPGAIGAACVSVMDAESGLGQVWTRTYARAGRFPQVVHSMKRFAGPTGLEEHVGHGVGMALDLSEERGALVFSSRFYFVSLGRWRWRVPSWLAPGAMRIVHRDLGDEFLFELTLTHPVFGQLIRQVAYFREV
ncbi:MAG: DUF4166 domain-containing protein [Hyphomicrobium sp.]|nr:DUF4166 domain-containing protein [Hyphomicrobium sp.]